MKPGVLAAARVFDQVLIPKSMLRPAIAPGSLQPLFFWGETMSWLPSGKRLHNYGKIHMIHGKIIDFYGHFH